MATPTAIELAAEAEKKAQEELKKKKAEEESLLDAYSTESGDIYGGAKAASEGLLGGAKSDIEALYGKGYSDLESLIGEQSEAQIKQSLRPIEGQLASQGLLGGPSGALNEALAGASERVRTEGLGKLQDYLSKQTGALADLYGSQATQGLGLEQQYGSQMQGLLAQALAQQLSTGQQGVDIAKDYGMAGLEGALGSNKITVETAAQKDLAQQQADLQAAIDAASSQAQSAQLQRQQQEWDSKFTLLVNKLMNSAAYSGMSFDQKRTSAEAAARAQLEARP